MEYVIKLKTNHTLEIIEKPKKVECDWYSKQIGCEWIEVVHPRYFECTLVIDEEGNLKPNRINLVASAMYGTFEHGDPIMGDVLIVNEGLVDGENDIIGFTLDEANKIKMKIEYEMLNSDKFQDFINGDL